MVTQLVKRSYRKLSLSSGDLLNTLLYRYRNNAGSFRSWKALRLQSHSSLRSLETKLAVELAVISADCA
jgi:hypothetical protein